MGGTTAEYPYPWLALLYLKIQGEWSSACGGSLITRGHVMTAAHCVHGASGKKLAADSLQVRLGVFDRQGCQMAIAIFLDRMCLALRAS